MKYICGVDEVGRGSLAGPVVAAAVILNPKRAISDLRDSKVLSELKRQALANQIKQQALSWSLGWANREEIDELNIFHATMLAMSRAVAGLSIQPDQVLIDGNKVPEQLTIKARAIVGGDKLHDCISAASILAKVIRDQEMTDLALSFPEYGFAKHKGYPTSQHVQALETYGVTEIHRRSFAPVRKAIDR